MARHTLRTTISVKPEHDEFTRMMNISPSRLYAAAVERQMGEIMRSNPNYIEDMQIGNPKVAKIWIEFIEKHPEICAVWRKMASCGVDA